MKILCPHPKCGGKTRFSHKCHGTEWLVCLDCRFTFPNIDTKRKR